MGLCPQHSRRLIEQVGGSHIMLIVLREALAGARQALRGEGRPGSCPACGAVRLASERACHVLSDGLCDPANARLYGDHTGMCLPHVLRAARTADRSTLEILAERLLASLHNPDDPGPELLAGIDRDAPKRGKLRRELAEERTADSTGQALCGRLEVEACPVCLPTGRAERDYVQWFLEQSRENDPSISNDPGELCSGHLHDVAYANSAVAAQAIERQRAVRGGELQRLLDRLAELPPTTRRSRRSGPDELAGAREEFVSERYCPGCHASSGVERSQVELVAAALPLAPVRELYEHSHGLCVPHAMKLSPGPAAQVARRHAEARVGVLAWEVEETARKYGWAYRHETGGPEHDAWLRALGQLDGRTFEGGPAHVSPNDHRRGVTGTAQRRELRDVAVRSSQILDEVERAVVGKREALELALCAFLADGHVLIEDYPGLAKTLIARSLATLTGTRFSRVQFTPDLMPSDVTGASIFNQRTAEFEFRPGPVFTNVLLADEINRAPPKTQAALLEAMQEHQVTIEDRTRPLERPFLVLATQNPIEYEGTYPLPEAQLDRFLIRMRVGYPSAEGEFEILERRLERREDEPELDDHERVTPRTGSGATAARPLAARPRALSRSGCGRAYGAGCAPCAASLTRPIASTSGTSSTRARIRARRSTRSAGRAGSATSTSRCFAGSRSRE